MKKTAVVYGLIGGVLIAGLKLIEYRFLVVEHSLEIYGGLVAAIFSAVGLWLGLRLTRPRQPVVIREVRVPVLVPTAMPPLDATPVSPRPPSVVASAKRPESLGITSRELDILRAMATGLSNREIAEQLHVSENTVKTHLARLFDKLGARRRTQAVQRAREAGLIA